MTVSEKLRLVQGLHSHAEMFGFNWSDGSDWTWHDVACKIADEIDAENAKLRELVGMMSKAIGVSATNCYGDCIAPYECSFNGGCPIQKLMRELGMEVDE